MTLSDKTTVSVSDDPQKLYKTDQVTFQSDRNTVSHMDAIPLLTKLYSSGKS